MNVPDTYVFDHVISLIRYNQPLVGPNVRVNDGKILKDTPTPAYDQGVYIGDYGSSTQTIGVSSPEFEKALTTYLYLESIRPKK